MKVQYKFILELTQEEAQWLRALVQNPLITEEAFEPPEHEAMRRKFWELLDPSKFQPFG